MAYKLYGRQVFRATVDGREFTFTCYGQGTSYGFRHICTRGENNFHTVNGYVRDKIIAKATYYNRTWESFQYETVLAKGIENLYEPQEIKDKLHAILIDGKAEEEHAKAEEEIATFEKLWNGLNDKNKEHIRNGLGDNLIQTEEQAHAVMGIMAIMNLMQD